MLRYRTRTRTVLYRSPQKNTPQVDNTTFFKLNFLFRSKITSTTVLGPHTHTYQGTSTVVVRTGILLLYLSWLYILLY